MGTGGGAGGGVSPEFSHMFFKGARFCANVVVVRGSSFRGSSSRGCIVVFSFRWFSGSVVVGVVVRVFFTELLRMGSFLLASSSIISNFMARVLADTGRAGGGDAERGRGGEAGATGGEETGGRESGGGGGA